MCVPNAAIREDGKGFMVQRAGVWFGISVYETFNFYEAIPSGDDPKHITAYGKGKTILEAVDNALASYEESRQRDKEEVK